MSEQLKWVLYALKDRTVSSAVLGIPAMAGILIYVIHKSQKKTMIALNAII